MAQSSQFSDMPNKPTVCRTAKGYLIERTPNHPRVSKDGYVYQHILVAEKALGRFLKVGQSIHHVNGKRDDNRPCNLVICECDAYHKLLHRRERALKATGNASSRQCRVCAKWFFPSESGCTIYTYPKSWKSYAYHKSCEATEKRRRRNGRA